MIIKGYLQTANEWRAAVNGLLLIRQQNIQIGNQT